MSDSTFSKLNKALRRAESGSEAAECHGTLCGILSSGRDGLEERWIEVALGDVVAGSAPVADCRAMLESLHKQTRAQLVATEFGFMPLLPDDDAPLEERVNALGAWCQGFLFGLGLAEVGEPKDLPNDVREVVEDFAEIARAGLAPDDDTTDGGDEEAYAELVEYLRVGAQLVHDELNPAGTSFRAPPGIH